MSFSKLAAFIDQLEAICGIPHCDISIRQKHKEIFRRSSGYTNTERTKKPTDQDLYWMYSASKVSLTVMILQLAEQGKLRLDDPVCKYIPEAADLQIRIGDQLIPCIRQATIEDYLAMQGGLDYVFLQRPDGLARQDEGFALREAAQAPQEEATDHSNRLAGADCSVGNDHIPVPVRATLGPPKHQAPLLRREGLESKAALTLLQHRAPPDRPRWASRP